LQNIFLFFFKNNFRIIDSNVKAYIISCAILHLASLAGPMLPEENSEWKAVSAQVRTQVKTANGNNFRLCGGTGWNNFG
jgi:hypothetical protein